MDRMEFTGSRIFDYANLRDLLRSRIITRQDYNTQVAQLQRKQAGIDKRSLVAAAKRDAKKLAKAKLAAAKRETAKEARKEAKDRLKAFQPEVEPKYDAVQDPIRVRRRITQDSVFDKRVGDQDFDEFLIELYNKVKNEGLRRLVINGRRMVEGEMKKQNIVDKEVDTGLKYKQFRLYFTEGGVSDGEPIYAVGDRVLLLKPSKIPVKKIVQYFARGVTHCVFQPILNKLENMLEGAVAKETKRKYANYIKNTTALKEKYEAGIERERDGIKFISHGVAIEEYNEIAKVCGLQIILQDVLYNDTHTFGNQRKPIRFRNTSLDHITQNYITLNDDAEEVSPVQMEQLWDQVRDTDKFMVEGDLKSGVPSKLYLNDRVVKLHNPNKEAFDEMDKIAQIADCQFNALKYPDVNAFIKSGRLINSWVAPLGDKVATGHIDMPQAYTQFKKCSFYDGFLGTIHQWRSGVFDLAFIKENVGIYKFDVLGGVTPLLAKLGIVLGQTYILPSVEILFFASLGLNVTISAGVWGARIDFEFPEFMMQEVGGIKRYSQWSGLKASEHHDKKYTFKCDETFACVMKEKFGDDASYWRELGVCSIKQKKKVLFTTHHITAFITSYVRIQMIQSMMKFPIENLVKVVLDGIYYAGEKPAELEWFKEKPLKEHSMGFDWYSDQDLDYRGNWSPLTIKRNTLITGQGGCGKSYSVLKDTGFNNVLYVAPTNVLGMKQREAYDCNYTTIHKLIGIDCRKFKEEKYYPSVIFVDELTQIEAGWIDKVFAEYPKSLIIIGGDIEGSQWFQCRNGSAEKFSEIWKPVGVDVIHMEGDRRSKDPDLAAFKLKVRDKMRAVFIDGDNGEEYRIKNYIAPLCIHPSDAIKKFNPGDIWLAGTHKTNTMLLENGIVSGWYKKGGYVAFEETEGYEKRGSFTIHSTQGLTIEGKKIFISVGDAFEYSMIYTAASRATHLDQLVFVA
jgi:hypothetical protein